MKRYIIVTANGNLRRGRSVGPRLYDTKGKAQNKCLKLGDSVVEVEIDLTKEPLFIKERLMNG